MHDKAADDHVDAVVIERQIRDVGGVHLDTIGDALETGVAQRVLGELPVWSARQMSTPIARPFESSLAAASNTAPRPQPRSSSVSSPRSCSPSRISAHTLNFPTRVV